MISLVFLGLVFAGLFFFCWRANVRILILDSEDYQIVVALLAGRRLGATAGSARAMRRWELAKKFDAELPQRRGMIG